MKTISGYQYKFPPRTYCSVVPYNNDDKDRSHQPKGNEVMRTCVCEKSAEGKRQPINLWQTQLQYDLNSCARLHKLFVSESNILCESDCNLEHKSDLKVLWIRSRLILLSDIVHKSNYIMVNSVVFLPSK